MTTTEFPVDLEADDNGGLGTLIVTDARLLIRPAVPGQYHCFDTHDSAHAYPVLNLGHDMDEYITHIFCDADPREAQQMLNRVFHCYIDHRCLQLGCDAIVRYVVGGKTVLYEEHGWDDGAYTVLIYVYCSVREDNTETLLAELTDSLENEDRFVVVRPDSSSELGYVAHGFAVDKPSEDDSEAYTWPPEDDAPYDDGDDQEDEDQECPLCGAQRCSGQTCQQ